MAATPLQFLPQPQPRPWGGRRLDGLPGRHLPADAIPYGESWDLVDRSERQSQLIEAWQGAETLHDLWTRHRRQVFGDDLADHPAPRFPLLCKLLDTTQMLSLQVHPNGLGSGAEPKEECWWVLEAGADSTLLAGFKAKPSSELLTDSIQRGNLAALMAEHRPKAGDFMQVHAGTVHAIGPNLLIAEIQQNSDCTYRLHDWGRVDAQGRARELHLSHGLQAIDPNLPCPVLQSLAASTGDLLRGRHYQLRRAMGQAALGVEGEMLIILASDGDLRIGQEWVLPYAQWAIIPACMQQAKRRASGNGWLEIRLPLQRC